MEEIACISQSKKQKRNGSDTIEERKKERKITQTTYTITALNRQEYLETKMAYKYTQAV